MLKSVLNCLENYGTNCPSRKRKNLNFNCASSVKSASDANDEIAIVQAQAISEIHCKTRVSEVAHWFLCERASAKENRAQLKRLLHWIYALADSWRQHDFLVAAGWGN